MRLSLFGEQSARSRAPQAIKSSGLCNVNFTATRWHAVAPAGLALLTGGHAPPELQTPRTRAPQNDTFDDGFPASFCKRAMLRFHASWDAASYAQVMIFVTISGWDAKRPQEAAAQACALVRVGPPPE
ncbi:MAG: hypothetical protein IPO15_09640 [Anaerolineae bacterium]|uniref:hypothetical protein n=1 Tax=Candidatus Amarolinea dominans TaxID=3140696 RepID=UPI003135107F|nr:hypothetical protein [Anaerolineae bacterium]